MSFHIAGCMVITCRAAAYQNSDALLKLFYNKTAFFSQILKCCCPDSILQVLYFNPPISFYTTFRYIIIHLAQLFGWTARFNLIRLYIGAIFIFI